MSSPSTTLSHSESDSARSLPSFNELNELVRDGNVLQLLDHTFLAGHTSTSDLRQFTSLSRIVRRMEQDLEQYRFEQELIFDDLLNSARYQQNISLIFHHYRTRNASPNSTLAASDTLLEPHDRSSSPYATDAWTERQPQISDRRD